MATPFTLARPWTASPLMSSNSKRVAPSLETLFKSVSFRFLLAHEDCGRVLREKTEDVRCSLLWWRENALERRSPLSIKSLLEREEALG